GRDAAAPDRATRGHRGSGAVSRIRLERFHDGPGAVRRRRAGDEMRHGLDRIWTRTGPRHVLAACALAAAACGVPAQQCPLGSTWSLLDGRCISPDVLPPAVPSDASAPVEAPGGPGGVPPDAETARPRTSEVDTQEGAQSTPDSSSASDPASTD